MDLRQLEYIVKIAEEKNITKASKKLFITQSALNQQLLKLEKELGAPLFFRSRNDFTLTEIGQIYITSAKKILELKKETYNNINNLLSIKNYHLSVGLMPERGLTMFASIYPKFHKLYPNIIVDPIELSVKEQENLITTGSLDIGFLTIHSDMQSKNNIYIPITKENILLAINSNNILSNYTTNSSKELDLNILKDENFALIHKDSTIRDILNPILKNLQFTPNILFETKSCKTLLSMVSQGICSTILPEYYLINCKNINCFYLPEKPQLDIVAIYKKGSNLNEASKCFIALAKEYWNNNIKRIIT